MAEAFDAPVEPARTVSGYTPMSTIPLSAATTPTS
jgi:hypothetical protein